MPDACDANPTIAGDQQAPEQGISRPIHLLHVFSAFTIGGTAVRMADLMNHFGPRYRHSVLSVDGSTACRSRLSADLDVDFPALPKASRNPVASVLRARQALQRIRPEVLLTYNWGAMDWALAHSLQPIGRHVHFEDGFGPQEAERQLLRRVLFRRLALRRVFRIVVPSTTLQTIAVRQWKFAPERVALIPNGIRCERYASTDREKSAGAMHGDGPLVVGTLAPLRAEKNLGLLIEAFAQIADKYNVHLVIAGDGPERARLEALGQTLGLDGRIRFLGHVDAVADVLAEFDVFALTSLTEQLPISLLEAMAAGKAVTAVDVGDVKRALSPDNRALVVAKSDRDGLTNALDALLGDAERRARLGAGNLAYVREHYPYGRMVQAYEALLSVTKPASAGECLQP